MHIKNSFDEWKEKRGEPFDPTKAPETFTRFNTNLTTLAVDNPLIVEEDVRLDSVKLLKTSKTMAPRGSAQALSEALCSLDNQLSVGSLPQFERANSKVYTDSSNSFNQNAGSGSATQLYTLKKSAAKSKFFKEDPNSVSGRPLKQNDESEAGLNINEIDYDE